MIDISDGLSKDLATLCAESSVGAIVLENEIPIPAAVAGAMGGDREAMTALALSSGEEYVALASVRGGEMPPGARVIGEITAESSGLAIVDSRGKGREMTRSGYEHEFER